jgi:hypothetical protein
VVVLQGSLDGDHWFDIVSIPSLNPTTHQNIAGSGVVSDGRVYASFRANLTSFDDGGDPTITVSASIAIK